MIIILEALITHDSLARDARRRAERRRVGRRGVPTEGVRFVVGLEHLAARGLDLTLRFAGRESPPSRGGSRVNGMYFESTTLGFFDARHHAILLSVLPQT